MSEITTLSQFLTTANTQFQVYDLGRRVVNIDMMAFHQIESLMSPYPYPIQGHAQFAIVFWQKSQMPYIWFLKLPLDEKGLLSPAPRSQFIKMILEALGKDLTQPLNDEEQQKLANHPFSFKPSQEKLAFFNALVRRHLGQNTSQQYDFAYQYLTQQTDNWQHVGLQGIADICARYDQLDHADIIMNAFKFAPDQVQIALCQCLENIQITVELSQLLLKKIKHAHDNSMYSYWLRGLASNAECTIQAIEYLEQQQVLDEHELITIAARNWIALKHDQTRTIYLEALAKQPQHFFNQIFADIVAIPLLRNCILTELRNPNRSQQLSMRIGGLFKATLS